MITMTKTNTTNTNTINTNTYKDTLLSLQSLAKLPKDNNIKPIVKTLEKVYKSICHMEENRLNEEKYTQFNQRLNILIDALLVQAGIENTQYMHIQQYNAAMQAFACKFSASKKYGTEEVKKASMATFKKSMLYNHKAYFEGKKWVTIKASDLKEGKASVQKTIKKSTIWAEAEKAMAAYIQADMEGNVEAKAKASEQMQYWQKMKAEYTAKQEAKKAKKAC